MEGSVLTAISVVPQKKSRQLPKQGMTAVGARRLLVHLIEMPQATLFLRKFPLNHWSTGEGHFLHIKHTDLTLPRPVTRKATAVLQRRLFAWKNTTVLTYKKRTITNTVENNCCSFKKIYNKIILFENTLFPSNFFLSLRKNKISQLYSSSTAVSKGKHMNQNGMQRS